MQKIKLKIGEFSKLCFVTVKTLRHYERIGLLTPHETDPWTGYRYYDVGQMEQMARIRNLKELGMSLDDIKELFEDGLMKPDKDFVGSKMSETREDIKRLCRRLQALEGLYEQTTRQKNMNKITIKPLPGGVVASFRQHLKSYDELGALCVNVIGPEMQRLGCTCPPETAYCFTVDYNRNHCADDIDLEYCEIVEEHHEVSDIIKFRDLPVVETAVCISHHGSYNTFGESVAEVFRYIEQHSKTIVGEPRFSYIHGVWDCESVDDWLTEIQIPVK